MNEAKKSGGATTRGRMSPVTSPLQPTLCRPRTKRRPKLGATPRTIAKDPMIPIVTITMTIG